MNTTIVTLNEFLQSHNTSYLDIKFENVSNEELRKNIRLAPSFWELVKSWQATPGLLGNFILKRFNKTFSDIRNEVDLLIPPSMNQETHNNPLYTPTFFEPIPPRRVDFDTEVCVEEIKRLM